MASYFVFIRMIEQRFSETAASVLITDLTRDSAAGTATRAAIREALEAMRSCSPRYLLWLQRYVRRIAIVPPSPSVASFEPMTGILVIGADAASRYDISAIGMLLAHEATHARLWGLGITLLPEDGAVFARIERRCNIEQLRCLIELAATHRLRPWAEEQVRNDEVQLRYRVLRFAMLRLHTERLRAHGIPRPVARCIVSFYAA